MGLFSSAASSSASSAGADRAQAVGVFLVVCVLWPAGLAAVAACSRLRVLTVGSFNLVRPLLGRQDLKRLEHLSFGGGFANKGLHLLFPLLELKSLHITVSHSDSANSYKCRSL